jgi:type I restriction enzyme R subunit
MTYTEDALVEQPAIQLFEDLEWETLNCFDEQFGLLSSEQQPLDNTKAWLGRENRAEVVLTQRLRSSLEKLNPDCSPTDINSAIEELSRDRSSMSPIAANEQCYRLIRDGVKVKSDNNDGDGQEDDYVTIQVIDWSDYANNDFLLCSQLFVTGEIETRRPDLIGFVNGLPLVFVELKSSHTNLSKAYNSNLKDYRSTIPHLFWFNQLIILSNGVQSKVGTISSQWEHFAEWKKIESENEARRVSLEVVIRGTCDRNRLLDLVENFTLYVKAKETIKIIAKYHQFLGVNQALEGLSHIKKNQGQLGVYWHTQGSGKSFSMVFFCQKAFRKVPGNWTFVMVTDRTDLDDQIYKTFNASGLLTEECQADSGFELKQLLSEDHRFVFTLIQKFRADSGEEYPLLSDREDVIVITDEAHRSQYDTLAMNMRAALPNAGFIAFTGTPLMAGEEKTRDVFGDYVSVYNFADAVDDGATLPLYYENRVPEVNLNRGDLGDEINRIIEDADLSDESEQRLEQEFSRAYHIITRDDRLTTIAEDIVEHYIGREPFSTGIRGKAMVVSIDKATAIKMYDKVKVAWQDKLNKLIALRSSVSGSSREKLNDDIAHMEKMDMAVVVSGGQGDYEVMESKGLDYKTHRERFIKEKLDAKFKDEEDPLGIVFVCAMWLTGFDAPSVSTLYLDKPLKNHTLMQTIARANRVYPGKACGQIVDYINIFGALQQALGVYGGGVSEPGAGYTVDTPAQEKGILRDELASAIQGMTEWLEKQSISLAQIIAAEAKGFEKLQLLDEASETVLKPDLTPEFVGRVRQINRIFKAILPDTFAMQFIPQRVAVNVIYAQMKQKSGEEIDDSDVLEVVRQQVNELLDESIETIYIGSHLPDPVDISGIDFDALAEMVERTKKPRASDAEKLKNIIELRLASLIEKNTTRQDFQEKFNQLIEDYNNGAHTAEQFFEELKQFINELEEEEKRGVREGLNEEELAIFDLLCKNVALSEKERNEVKAVAHELLEKLRDALVIDWRKKQRTKARVQSMIQDVLDKLPEVYDEELWPKACENVYMHVFDKYAGEGRSVYH